MKKSLKPLKQQPIALKVIATNKKALFNYSVLERIEAGIVLSGGEIKSVRTSSMSLNGSYAKINARGQAELHNLHIKPYIHSHDIHSKALERLCLRPRKLLLKKKELRKLQSSLEAKGRTLIPLEAYLKKQWLKISLGLCQGKKLYDKRRQAKQKQMSKDIERTMKHRYLHK